MRIILDFINEYGTTTIYTILMGIISYIGMKLKNIIEEYINELIIKDVVKTVCEAVNQIYNNLSGSEKLLKTLENTKQILLEKGIKYTELELKMYIESNISCIKKERSDTL